MLKKNIVSVPGAVGIVSGLFLTMVLCFAASAPATTHIVKFGGSTGFAYSPISFSAQIGDTVQWNGDFSMHPLSSTTIPSGAATWHAASGSAFVYPVKIAGTFNYKCDLHVGMTGSFSVPVTATVPVGGVRSTAMTALITSKSGRSFLQLTLQNSSVVSASLFSLDGREVPVISNTRFEPGVFTVPLHFQGHEFHVLSIRAGNRNLVKEITLNTRDGELIVPGGR